MSDITVILIFTTIFILPVIISISIGIYELIAQPIKFENKLKQLEDDYNQKLKSEQNKLIVDMKNIVNERCKKTPWLAQKYADYFYLLDCKNADYLMNKLHKAPKAADKVKEIAREKSKLQKQCKIYEYQLKFYEDMFPWLEDFKEIPDDEIKEILNLSDGKNKDDEYTYLKKWLSPLEYSKLSSTDKYQLALDRYKSNKSKSNWQIGIDYERYIGYVYEKKGYKVKFQGAIEGLNDLGRDIIAENNDEIFIVQCKYWREERIVREKHIFQLFGTTFIVKEQHPNKKTKGILITTSKVSETAEKFAKALNIEIKQGVVFDKNYPCVKCNINQTTKEKIYHLPFDQQYDKVSIYLEGELYVKTVKEAENLGFRRAKKWYLENVETQKLML